MAKIAVDEGHWGYDSGAVGPTGLREADVTADIVSDATLGDDNGVNVAELLRAAGHEVLVIKSSGAGSLNEDLAQRVNQANAWGADLYVSVHVNCCDSSQPSYVSTWIYGTGGEAERAAKLVQPRLVKATGAPDGGIRTANFYVLRKTIMPAFLVECMFISNPDQEGKLKTEAMRDACARAIVAGVLEYFGGEAVQVEGWKEQIMADAKAAGLISEGHNPDDAASKWFVLAVVQNAMKQTKTDVYSAVLDALKAKGV